jgi:hypothetical protein
VQIQYRPSYAEVADAGIRQQYQSTEGDMIASREASEYIRKKIAQIEIDAVLRELASLPTNWDSYGSESPSKRTVSIAGDIAKAFVNFGLIPDAITPSPEGGIAIYFTRNQKYADIECFNSGDVFAVRYSSSQEPTAWVVQPGAVPNDATIQTFSEYLSA